MDKVQLEARLVTLQESYEQLGKSISELTANASAHMGAIAETERWIKVLSEDQAEEEEQSEDA